MKSFVLAILARVYPVLIRVRSMYRRIRQPITIGVRALIVHDEQVVLMRTHGSDQWDLPGGGVKRGETLRAAAVREAREETGCKVEVDGVLGVYLNTQNKHSDHITVFVCRPRTALGGGLNFEIAQARAWPLDALPANMPPATLRRLAEYQANKRNIEAPW